MKKVRQLLFPIFALLTIITISACAGTPTPASTPGLTAIDKTSTSTLPVESTPSATVAANDLPTPLPTAVPSPITVAYVNADHNLYVWGDGEPGFTQITSDGDAETAVLSSDGSLVAYSRSTDGSTYSLDVVSSDGSNHQTLFTQADFLGLPRPEQAINSQPDQFAWQPNSHRLAMATRYEFEGPGRVIAPDLIQFDIDNGTHRVLLNENEDYQFAYSPDGSKIAISLPDGIDLFSADGEQLLGSKFFTFANVNTATEAAFLPSVTWSPDGESFAFVVPPADPLFGTEIMSRVVKIDARNGAATTLLSAPMAFQMTKELSPELSAVAFFVSTSTTSSSFDLHIASLAGGTDVVAASLAFSTLFAWSPDGMHYLYTTVNGSAFQAQLGEAGGSTSPITEIANARDFVWLDADRYLILDQTNTGWKVWLGNINSSPTVLYTDTLTSAIGPSITVNR